MLDCLLDFEGTIPTERQQLLFATLQANKDWENLSRMCLRPDLEPDLDLKLSKVPSAKVKAAWMARPGRTSEEIAKAVRGERRITVLESLAASSTDENTLLGMLQAAQGLRIALAVAKNENAPASTKQVAGRILGQRLDSSTTRSLRAEALKVATQQPDLLATFAANTTDMDVLVLACDLDDPSPQLRNHIKTAGILVPLKKLCEYVAANDKNKMQYGMIWKVRERIEVIGNVVASLGQSTWVSDEEMDQVLDAWKEARSTHLNKSDWHDSFARVIKRVDSTRGGGSLIGGAATAPADKIPAILKRLESLPWRSELKTVTAKTIVGRTDLPLQLRMSALNVFPTWEVVQFPQRYDMPMAVLGLLSMRYAGLDGTGVIDSLRKSGHVGWEQEIRNILDQARKEKMQPLAERAAQVLLNSELVDDDLIATMPLQFVVTFRGPDANRILSKLLSEHLPDNLRVWEEFERLSTRFPGTVHEAVIVAKAACGVA